MIPCRCAVLNTLAGRAATDYARQHLDTVREDSQGTSHLTCPDEGTSFVLERDGGVYGGDDQRRLRRVG